MLDGREFIEYGMGLRSVTLGHAHPAVVEAAAAAMRLGTNFTRPSPLEADCAERLLGLVRGADMAKFCKNGSDATTAALKLSRAWTGRDLVAICRDQPFFSTDDWFIGSTTMPAGIPQSVRDQTVGFRYNDLESVDALFARYPGQIACLVLEPAAAQEPGAGFLEGLRDRCRAAGALLVFDEMITGFRWHLGGAQTLYGVTPDLSTFGKALANGFALSALVGRRDVMERGGLRHDAERVFLLSTTHGAETHALAAGIETMKIYEREGVVEVLHRQGARLRSGIEGEAKRQGVGDHFRVLGRDCNLVVRGPRRGGQTVAGLSDARPPGDPQARRSHALARRQLRPRRRGHRPDGRSRGRGAGGLPAGARRRHRAVPRGASGAARVSPAELTTAAEPMLRLELPRRTKGPLQVLCLGAHSDDIEIGCGGTILDLIQRRGPLEVRWVVFSGNAVRAKEARASARALLRGARSRIETKRFRDGFFPAQTARLKEEFERLKRRVRPDLIFCPWRGDAHQDHRLLAELAWNTFRDHLILEYEIPKYDGDLSSPNLYVPLAEETCRTQGRAPHAGLPLPGREPVVL